MPWILVWSRVSRQWALETVHKGRPTCMAASISKAWSTELSDSTTTGRPGGRCRPIRLWAIEPTALRTCASLSWRQPPPASHSAMQRAYGFRGSGERSMLTPEAWIAAATDALVDRGIDAVRVELAIRAWARRDALARQAVDEVDERRLGRAEEGAQHAAAAAGEHAARLTAVNGVARSAA